MRIVVALLCLFVIIGSAGAAPQGPVVLTVVGAIDKTNRGRFDPFGDVLAKTHEVNFLRAFAFDRAMLEGHGTKSLAVQYPGWPSSLIFEGPLLRDVLAAAGATGTRVTVFALDGYSAEIAMQDLNDYPVLLAL